MKNLALIFGVLSAMTSGVFGQGQLTPDADSPGRNPQAHSLSAAGWIAPGAKEPKGLARKVDLMPPLVLVLAKHRGLVLTNTAAQNDGAAPAEFFDADIYGDLSLKDHFNGSDRAVFPSAGLRAWAYDASYASAGSVGSDGLLASAQIITLHEAEAAGGASGYATRSIASSNPSVQQSGDESDVFGPRRLIIPNIASPEPNTVALAIIGGGLLGWRQLAKRRGDRCKFAGGS
jgi:hypothetical protein